jgi:site-specific DNA-methyltransferase (adenine-specific)/modification methylase
MDFEKIELAGGRAVLYRGDSLELLEAGLLKCDAIVSDPPYGIGYQRGGEAGGGIKAPRFAGKIIGDDAPFDPAPWLAHAGDKAVVLFGADHYKTRLPEGGRFICWDKSCGQGPAATFSDAEFAWTNRRNARSIFRHFWAGATRADDSFDGKAKGRAHVSQKPVNLMAWCIEHARIGLDKVVLDPYMGAGSTGVAALLSGRRFVGVEIDPGHFATARARIEEAARRMGLPGAAA